MRQLKLLPADGRLRARGGRGGEAAAHRQRSDRQGDRAVPRARLRQAPLQLDADRHHRGPREGHARGLPELLRHLLPAQQRDADRRRRRRRGDGAQAGRAALRSRSRAAPSRRAPPPSEPPQTAPRDRDAAHRGPDPGRRRRLPHPARRRSRHAGAGGAGDDPVGRRVVAPAPAAGAAGAAGDRGRRRRRGAGGPGLFIIYAAYLPDRDAAKVEARAGRGDRARARQAGRRPTSWRRPRTSWPPGSCSACRPSTASRRRWGARSYVEGDWRRFVRGRRPLPGGHRRRRAAGGAQVPRSTPTSPG